MPVPTRRLPKRQSRFFTVVHVNMTRHSQKNCNKSFKLDIRTSFFTIAKH